MTTTDWLQVPVGRGAGEWVTAQTQRRVLAIVHTLAGAGHLLDAVELLETDSRIQVVFSQAPDLFSNGVSQYLRDLRGIVIPWHQAIHTSFDLALATDCAGLHELQAPVLFLSHGVMNNKWAPAALGGPSSGLVVGLATPWLTWYGRLVPRAVALPHGNLLQVLARHCPQAVPAAVVVGDLCLDRLTASRPYRDRYRKTLEVDERPTIVAINSTWGPNSLFGKSRELLFRLLRDLPRESYRVVAAMHPALWFGHGPRQIMGWLSEQRRRGLRLVDPLSWRGVVAAADVLIGDHGSATTYAAATGVPVLRAPKAPDSVGARSASAVLAEMAPELTGRQSIEEQLRTAIDGFGAEERRTVAESVTSEPGRAAPRLRSEMYKLLRLAEPTDQPDAIPVAAARPTEVTDGVFL